MSNHTEKEIEFIEAVKSGDVKKIKNLIKEGADVDLAVDDRESDELHGAPVLFWAEDMKTVKTLVKAGAIINATDWDEQNILYFVSNLKIAEYLIKQGACLNTHSFLSGDEAHNMETPLCYRSNDIEMCKLFLKHGANIDYQNNSGRTALIIHIVRSAYDDYHREGLENLLNLGADPTIKDNDNMTALDYAQEQGDEEVIELLEKYIEIHKNKKIDKQIIQSTQNWDGNISI